MSAKIRRFRKEPPHDIGRESLARLDQSDRADLRSLGRLPLGEERAIVQLKARWLLGDVDAARCLVKTGAIVCTSGRASIHLLGPVEPASSGNRYPQHEPQTSIQSS